MHPSLFRGALIAAALSAQFAFDACVSSGAFAAEIKFTAPTSARLPDGGALRSVADYGDYALFAMPEDEFRAWRLEGLPRGVQPLTAPDRPQGSHTPGPDPGLETNDDEKQDHQPG